MPPSLLPNNIRGLQNKETNLIITGCYNYYEFIITIIQLLYLFSIRIQVAH